ncbi:MAG: hypothetical protein IKV94_05505 [Clostridia bacterium]|nr:hypothetical protein [Clostridia bacterium]
MKKRGITLIALVIIIITVGILTAVITIDSDNTIKETKARIFATEVKQLEYLIKTYKERNNNSLDFTPQVLNVSSLQSGLVSELMEQGETIVDNNVTLYKIDYVKIDATSSEYGLQTEGTDDIYLVSNETGNVYYLKGFEFNDNVYYTLKSELSELIGE